MDCEQKTLINFELTQGKELANQIKIHLDRNSGENCEFLVEKILSSYEKALSMLKHSSALKMEEPLMPGTTNLESPHSFTSDDSPKSEISDQSHKNVFEKRKALPQWSEQVRVSIETGLEGPLGDGYSWRKYGQKDILGASFPRAYYRCTHRHTQGCLATKQVQKSDEDQSILELKYIRSHTCNQTPQLTTSFISLEKEGKKQKKENNPQPKQEDTIQKPTGEILFNFGNMERFPSFSFPSAQFEYENMENDFMGNYYSLPFMSQESSESNYFSLSTCSMDNFGISQNLQSSEVSGLTDLLSAPNSVTNSPIGDLGFSLDQVDFDPNLPLDSFEFLQ